MGFRLYGFTVSFLHGMKRVVEVYEIIFHGAERDDSCRRKTDGSSVERGLALLAARFSIYLSIYLSRPQRPARTYTAECLLQAGLPHGVRRHFALAAERPRQGSRRKGRAAPTRAPTPASALASAVASASVLALTRGVLVRVS